MNHEIPYVEPITLFRRVANRPWSMLLDSADHVNLHANTNRYSYICIDPFDTVVWDEKNTTSFDAFQQILDQYVLPTLPDLPPFQGGAAGYFSYDLCHEIENMPYCQDDMQFPLMMFGLYDCVVSFDHLAHRAWVVSTGLPEKTTEARKSRALSRLTDILHWLKDDVEKAPPPTIEPDDIHAMFDQSAYEAAVERCRQYILAGDIFEVNLSQRFSISGIQRNHYFPLYESLRAQSPAPFSAYLHFDDVVLASSSPERFLRLQDKCLEARPIKGTIRRGKTSEEDVDLAESLLHSDKDRAENIMIVDLMRNDFSKICDPNSVTVEALCRLESYANVHHLVSVITGKCLDTVKPMDVITATFPGGSITGAPKIRAMEIIAELERNARGPYCGSIGFIGFNGAMDLSITIRTFCMKNQMITFQAGGAVVLDSDPAGEYQETLDKLSGLKAALMRTALRDDPSLERLAVLVPQVL